MQIENCYSGTKRVQIEILWLRNNSLFYRNWEHHVCHKRMCETKATDGAKQTLCFPSCPWLQGLWDTSTQIILKLWIINEQLRHWCVHMYIWSWTEMLNVSLRWRAKTLWNSASYEYRIMSTCRGAQFLLIGIPTLGWIGWLIVLRINVDLAIFQPYLDLEAGDNQSLKIQVVRPGIEPGSCCSASQELNHSTTAAPDYRLENFTTKMLSTRIYKICWLYLPQCTCYSKPSVSSLT